MASRVVRAGLDEASESALSLLMREGRNESDAVRTALVEAGRRRNRRSAVADAVRRLLADPHDTRERIAMVDVSEYEPDNLFALRMIEGALPIYARITFEPTDHGTRVTLAAHGQPTGSMRLAQPLLSLSLKRQFAGYLATLTHLLEHTPQTN